MPEVKVQPQKKGVMELLPKGTLVQVTIIQTPSEKAIFDKVVYVQ